MKTSGGLLRGVYVESVNLGYYSFKGIPYGEPPIGNLRFRSPVPHKGWSQVRDAAEHGSFCANKFGFFGLTQTVGGSEDCLFLNVYTPDLKGKRAVMFWIHGGAFMSGNGDALTYGPEPLVSEDVVLVTVNYRYSAFGFLSTGDEHAPGNQGMKDLVLALEWVRDNIQRFGGDADKVTIFGHSAGSVAVHLLMLSDMAKGLYQQAILQSGASLMTCLFQPDPRSMAEELGRKLGLTFNSTKELVEKLRAVDYQSIVNAEKNLFAMPDPWALRPFDFSPSVDPKKSTEEKFLSKTPLEILLSGNYRKVPMMIGGPDVEGMFASIVLQNPDVLNSYNQNPAYIPPSSFELQPNSKEMNETVDAMRNLYFEGRAEGTLVEWLNIYTDGIFKFPSDRAVRFHAADNSRKPIFYYNFNFDGSLNFFKKLLGLQRFQGACHSDELFYLFSTELSGFIPDVNSTLVRKRMTKMWSNFAKLG